MDKLKDKESKLKQGRVGYYISKDYNKNIGIEWSLRFDPFNAYIDFDGVEQRYIFCFWFIWVFYISFNNIFKKFPKEWNSCTNNGKGGYLDTASRIIGVSQYGWSTISLYVWHDGEDSWYPDKEKKIYHKYLWLDKFFIGDYKYVTLDSEEKKEVYIDLPESREKAKINYRYWYKTYKRFYMKPFQHKGKNLFFHENEDIKIPTHDPKSEFYKDLEDYEKETFMKKCWIDIKKDETIEDGIKKYTEKVLKIREYKAGKENIERILTDKGN